MSINGESYKSAAPIYLDRGWWPMPARKKVVLVEGATGYDGVVDPEKVASWINDPAYASANCAVRADGWIGIDVDAYGDKRGDETLASLEAELGALPATISSTSRGNDSPSRIYFFAVPAGLHFITRLPDIEIIQQAHRYAIVHPSTHPETGQSYEWYGYEDELLHDIPSVNEMEALPEAWLNRLLSPTEDLPKDHAGFDGSVGDWLQRAPQGVPGLFMQARIAEIPRGEFGHDTMISLQASFVSLAAQGEAGAAEALSSLRLAWLRGQYDTPEYRRDFDVSLASAIKKYGALPASASDMGDQDRAIALIAGASAEMVALWVDATAHVDAVVCRALDEGMPFVDAATLGWHSAAARVEGGVREGAQEEFWQHCLSLLASDAPEEQGALSEEAGDVPAVTAQPGRRVSLLTDSERLALLEVRSTCWSGDVRWWGDQFMDVMIANHPVLSDPYYRMNRWLLLALVFAPVASLQFKSSNEIPLNFYMGLLGPSHSGKSESLRPVRQFARTLGELLMMDNPDIGGDATSAALTAALIRRDGQPSLFHSDEADAVIRNWSDERGPFSDMKQRITDLYNGDVNAIQRQGQKDISGIHARAFLNVHLTGIDDRIADAIDPEDWRTGFINRFIWARGDRKQRSHEQRRTHLLRRGDERVQKGDRQPWINEWLNRMNAIRSRSIPRVPGNGPAPVYVTEEVDVRHAQTDKLFDRLAESTGQYADRVEPTFGRYKVYVLKCAALVALSEGRDEIQMSDYLIALEQVEEWAETALEMVEATDLSPRARRVNRLASIIEAKGGVMAKSEIYREKSYAGDSRDVDGLLKELEAQRRAETLPSPTGGMLVRILKDAA